MIQVPISGDQSDNGSLGHAAAGSYYLYDFWNDKLVGVFAGNEVIGVTLKPYQALSYSLHRKQQHPRFLSTNRHITQGLMDLQDVKWDGQTYSGVAKAAAGEPFVIVVASNGHRSGEVSASVGEALIEPAAGGLHRVTIKGHHGGDIQWSIRCQDR